MRLELRTRETIGSVLVFSLLVAFIFNFAFDPSPLVIGIVGPGMVWVAYIFAGMLGLNRSISMEKDQGTLDGLLLAPVGRDVIFAGKMMSVFTLMVVVELLMAPVFLVLYDLSLFHPWVLVIALQATLGFAAVGTVFSAMAANTRTREVLLPLLFLPVVMPVIIGAVTVTRFALDGGGWDDVGRWIQLLLAFDVIFIVLSSLGFAVVLEE